MKEKIIQALQSATEKDAKNAYLWIHYGDLLLESEKSLEALNAYRIGSELIDDKRMVYKKMLPLLRNQGHVAEALIRAEVLLEEKDEPDIRHELLKIHQLRDDEQGIKEQQKYLDQTLLKNGENSKENEAPEIENCSDDQKTHDETDKLPSLAPVTHEVSNDELAELFDWDDLHINFDKVAGLDSVKKQINLKIIAPLKNPKIYEAFHRPAGGGILLYGPPGCGKTYIARATAGECQANFMAVNIHDIVDKYWGESEKIIHFIFEKARQKAPTILFFDEFDALGASRGQSGSQFWKTLVNQLLQEMDGVKKQNDQVLLFAATNMPWNVDTAFRRPGRFDRIIFVSTPDQKARAQMLRYGIEKLPGKENIPIEKLVKKTPLFTGADLKSLCERASENALIKSLESGEIHHVKAADFYDEIKKMQSSAEEWIASGRNYARYANESGQYDDLCEFLKRYKKW
ncbi:AAA family ATPase [Candidatus Uabimicrobium sp. HlEnr_7]|uniref:AAA family ATPase n=1 Tax=Candidatus Uabimicrobium helgolandensis TaxID=3095367 RepID=UPI00355921E4